MKIYLLSSISLNGMIGDFDGNEDFLSNKNRYFFEKFAKQNGGFVVGRKTFDLVQNRQGYNFDSIQAKGFIVSNSKKGTYKNYYFGNIESIMENSKKYKLKGLVVAGGSQIYSQFITQNLIDEIVLNIESVIVGKGISVFDPMIFQKRLEHIKTQNIGDGIIQLKYKVLK